MEKRKEWKGKEKKKDENHVYLHQYLAYKESGANSIASEAVLTSCLGANSIIFIPYFHVDLFVKISRSKYICKYSIGDFQL